MGIFSDNLLIVVRIKSSLLLPNAAFVAAQAQHLALFIPLPATPR